MRDLARLSLPILLLVLTTCRFRSEAGPVPGSAASTAALPPLQDDGEGHAYRRVSLLLLIAGGQRFDGERVSVAGVLNLSFEGNALYFHRVDLEHGLVENAVWISLSPEEEKKFEKYNQHYVRVVGTYSSRSRGHMSLFSGSLGEVQSMQDWPPDPVFAQPQPGQRKMARPSEP